MLLQECWQIKKGWDEELIAKRGLHEVPKMMWSIVRSENQDSNRNEFFR